MTRAALGPLRLALLLVTPPYAILALATFPLPRLPRYRVISGWSRLVIHAGARASSASAAGRGRGARAAASRPSSWPSTSRRGRRWHSSCAFRRSAGHEEGAALAAVRRLGPRADPPHRHRPRARRRAREQIARAGPRAARAGHVGGDLPRGHARRARRAARYQSAARCSPPTAGTPIVPMAHNAGEFWPRNAFRKRPGTVTVVIGPPIESARRDAADDQPGRARVDRRTARRPLPGN